MNDPSTKQDDPRPERIRRMKQHIQSNNRLSKVLRETREQLKSALAELAALKARAAEDTRRLEQMRKLQDLTLSNEIRWMQKHDEALKLIGSLRDWKPPDGVLQVKDLNWFKELSPQLDAALRKENPSDALER